MHALFRLVGVWVVILLVTGCGHLVYSSGPYRGWVLDAETKEPLVGAAVLMILYKQVPVGGHMPEAFVDAVEVLTDVEGEFTISRQTHAILFGWLLRPTLVAYYPGYAPYPSLHARPQGRDVTIAYEQKVFSVELPRSKTREERVEHAGVPIYAGGVPEEKMPNLIHLVNNELNDLGLQPIGGWKEVK